MSKTELTILRSRARKACLTALRKLAKDFGLSTQRVATGVFGKTDTKAGFTIRNHVGFGMNVLAGIVIMGRNGYLSCFPHGGDYHSMLRESDDGPGWGWHEDWERFIKKPLLGYMDFAHGSALFADNVNPNSEKEILLLLKVLEITKESCAWGRRILFAEE